MRKSGERARRTNAAAATSFVLGGSLFAAGAALAQSGAEATLYCSVYLAGGFFFSCGGYASVLLVVNRPRQSGPGGELRTEPWRWFAREPERIEWLSAAVLFVGTLVFAINIVDSFFQDLGAVQEDRLVWSPDVIGCVLFLLSGHLAILEIGHGRRVFRPAELEWWIVVVNQLGSVLFMVAAIASFVEPGSGSVVNFGISNWGTLTGALCFALAGLMQEFERPPA